MWIYCEWNGYKIRSLLSVYAYVCIQETEGIVHFLLYSKAFSIENGRGNIFLLFFKYVVYYYFCCHSLRLLCSAKPVGLVIFICWMNGKMGDFGF